MTTTLPILPDFAQFDRNGMVRIGFIAADFAVRVFAPLALENRGRPDQAQRLRALPTIDNVASARTARDETTKIRIALPADAADSAVLVADEAAYASYLACDLAASAEPDHPAYASTVADNAVAFAVDSAFAAFTSTTDRRGVDRRPVYRELFRMIALMLAAQ